MKGKNMQTKPRPNPIELCLRVSACLPLIALLAIILPLAAIEVLYVRQKKKR
jgi:hypothetical protein